MTQDGCLDLPACSGEEGETIIISLYSFFVLERLKACTLEATRFEWPHLSDLDKLLNSSQLSLGLFSSLNSNF